MAKSLATNWISQKRDFRQGAQLDRAAASGRALRANVRRVPRAQGRRRSGRRARRCAPRWGQALSRPPPWRRRADIFVSARAPFNKRFLYPFFLYLSVAMKRVLHIRIRNVPKLASVHKVIWRWETYSPWWFSTSHMVDWHMAQYFHCAITSVANSLGAVDTARHISVPQGFTWMRERISGLPRTTFWWIQNLSGTGREWQRGKLGHLL